jgi:phosphoribosylanthranilate isomerase
MKVKICGITNPEDATAAANLGADALGFIFVKESPRYIAPAVVRSIIDTLPPFIVCVGVFANTPREEIHSVVAQTGIGCVQLHGDETPEPYTAMALPVIKAFRMRKDFQAKDILRFPAAAYLLDTYVEGVIGGTGNTCDWKIAASAKAYGRIILAGGLTPENISEAVQKVMPYAVDIGSGVELAPGKKDKQKLQQLFINLRTAGLRQ